MKEKRRKLLSSIVSFTVASTLFITSSASAYSDISSGNPFDSNEKITPLLLEKFGVSANSSVQSVDTTTNDALPVLIWCSDDIDYSVIEAEVPFKSSADKMFDLSNDSAEIWLNNDTTYSEDILDYLEDNSEKSNFIQSSIETERELSKEMYTEINNKFVEEYLSDDDVVYISQYSPVIIADLTYSEVAELAESYDTQLLDYYECECEEEMDVSIPVIRANEVQTCFGISGYTGTGIKIGQAESGIPDKTNAQLSPIASRIYTNTSSSTYVTSHATMVASIMVGQKNSSLPAGVAPGATLYSIMNP